jgi:hypothetical protein
VDRKSSRPIISILIVGFLLSATMIVPSIRSLPLSEFSIVYHSVMLAALTSPFAIICLLFRNNPSPTAPIIFATAFSLTHAYLIFVSYAYPPQEFGYSGLILAPPVEAIVAIPAALLVIFTINRSRQS